MKLTKQSPLGPVFISYCVAVCVCNSGAEVMMLNVGHFAGSGVGNVPKRHAVLCGSGGPKRRTAKAEALRKKR